MIKYTIYNIKNNSNFIIMIYINNIHIFIYTQEKSVYPIIFVTPYK